MAQKFSDFMDVAREMTKAHHKEVNLFGEPLNIDELGYEECFNDNQFLVFEIWLPSGMVGYAGFFMYEHLMHKGSVHAKQDILFIDPAHRGHGLALKFLEYCDERLKEIGVHFVVHSIPEGKDWSPLLVKAGYHKMETNYTRRL